MSGWGAVIAGVISAAGSVYASKQAKKKSRSQKDMEGILGNNARLSGQYGEDMLGRSKEALNPVYDYYKGLASGDRNEIGMRYQDEIGSLTEGSREAFQTGSELAPRSGIATEMNSRIPMNNAAAIARIIGGGRREGITGLANLGTNWGSLGLSALGQGSGAAGQVLGYENVNRANQRQAGMDAGDSAYAIFKLISDAYSGRQAAGANNKQLINQGNQVASFWGLGQ